MARELTDPTLELLEEFTAAWSRGETPDPLDVLQRAPSDERRELSRLIDRFLVRQPNREPTAESLAYVQKIAALADEPDTAPLRALRERLDLTVSSVVQQLREALDLSPALERRLGEAYEDLERDWLDPRRVQPPVWAALRNIFKVDVRRLVSAETHPPVAAVLMRRDSGEGPSARTGPEGRPRDEIDELFRGDPVD